MFDFAAFLLVRYYLHRVAPISPTNQNKAGRCCSLTLTSIS
jgi:hypothetical protein